ELRPVADDGEDLHLGEATMAGRCVRLLGPLAQLVEQGTLNPKVAGSIPARPTQNALETGRFFVTLSAAVTRGQQPGQHAATSVRSGPVFRSAEASMIVSRRLRQPEIARLQESSVAGRRRKIVWRHLKSARGRVRCR